MVPRQHTLVVIRHAKAEQVAATDLERELTGPGGPTRLRPGSGSRLPAYDRTTRWCPPPPGPRRRGRRWPGEPAGRSTPTSTPASTAPARTPRSTWCARWTRTAACAVIVGHNPTMAVLAQLLDDGEGDVEAGNAMAAGFPTSAVAVFEVAGAWADLDVARLTGFHVGRG